MSKNLLFEIPNQVTPENFEATMHQAITLELATIPTYLSTYYSINRTPDQTTLYNQILTALPDDYDGEQSEKSKEDIAKDLTLDIMVYSNQSAALIMSVLIEEMLHLALSSNVRQALCSPPELVDIAKVLTFPTQLDGHKPEFPISLGKLSIQQLITFLKIESPNPFTQGTKETDTDVDTYHTIGEFYDMIIKCVRENYADASAYNTKRPQLVQKKIKPEKGPNYTERSNSIYSPNSINTVYYDRAHKPQFMNHGDSGGLIHVKDADSAVEAMCEIIHQGEGTHTSVGEPVCKELDADYTKLEFDEHGMPIPLEMDGEKVLFKPGDYDDGELNGELSHFAKFMEVYTLALHYEKKFGQYGINFFDLFVHDQPENPKRTDYEEGSELFYVSEMGNALFTYIILMVETCYYKEEKVQFKIFMLGVHKAMIWLLSQFGRYAAGLTFVKDNRMHTGALSFEYYPFENEASVRPKQQMYQIAGELIAINPEKYGWLLADGSYLPSLPDVGLDHSVAESPTIPAETVPTL